MICFCGDSYVQDEFKPKSWTRMLASKLYLDKFEVDIKESSKFIKNYGIGGTSIDYLIEEQLVKTVLPHYPQNPFEYLVIVITHNERFDFTNEITFVGHHRDLSLYSRKLKENKNFSDIDDEVLLQFVKSQINYRLLLDDYFFERRKVMITNLANFFKLCGTKVFIVNVEKIHGYYADESMYCAKKSINSYIDSHSNIEVYSNHFNLDNNKKIVDAFYSEIVNKYK